MPMNWLEEFKKVGALWIHDGNPLRPHALLSAGGHSNGFFNASLVIEQPNLLSLACKQLLLYLADDDPSINVVVGSAMGAVTMAHECARLLGVRCAFTEQVGEGANKQMALKRFSIAPESRVLLVEDVVTGGGTTRQTRQAVEQAGGVVLPKVLVLVNRSGHPRLDDLLICALIEHPMPVWQPDECPLCQAGSEAVRPKGNWDRLNTDY